MNLKWGAVFEKTLKKKHSMSQFEQIVIFTDRERTYVISCFGSQNNIISLLYRFGCKNIYNLCKMATFWNAFRSECVAIGTFFSRPRSLQLFVAHLKARRGPLPQIIQLLWNNALSPSRTLDDIRITVKLTISWLFISIMITKFPSCCVNNYEAGSFIQRNLYISTMLEKIFFEFCNHNINYTFFRNSIIQNVKYWDIFVAVM